MVAALALRALGHSVRVLEADSGAASRPGSRAIFIHRESLKLLEQIYPGLGRHIADHGLVWKAKRTFWRGCEVFVRHYPPASNPSHPSADLPPFTSLPQTMLEKILMEACQTAGIELSWNQRITDVASGSEGVRVSTSAGTSGSALYLIGADGARSRVRQAAGTSLEGGRSTHSYVVVDVAEDSSNPLPQERIFHYEHPGVGRRNVLLVPFQGGWRIDLQCHKRDNPEHFSREEGVRRWLPRVLPARYAERVTWVSTYQFRHAVVGRFTDPHHRILLTGDAAHLFAPFGARGMNSGLVDARVAVDAIHTALKTTDRAEQVQAIEHFAQIRHAAAAYNCAASYQALMHIQAPGIALRAKRLVAALAAPYSERAGVWLDAGPYGPRGGPSGKAAGSKY